MKYLYAFIGGAIVGAAAAILFAPESGDQLRDQIRDILRRNGLLKSSDEEALVEQIVAEIQAEK